MGKIHIPSYKPRRVELFESKGSPGHWYRVEETKDGDINCDCPAKKGTCWHIKKFIENGNTETSQ